MTSYTLLSTNLPHPWQYWQPNELFSNISQHHCVLSVSFYLKIIKKNLWPFWNNKFAIMNILYPTYISVFGNKTQFNQITFELFRNYPLCVTLINEYIDARISSVAFCHCIYGDPLESQTVWYSYTFNDCSWDNYPMHSISAVTSI